jgi:hypothetical protein
MESQSKQDSSVDETIEERLKGLIENSMVGDQDELYFTIIGMLTRGLDLGINNVRILYGQFPEGQSKEVIRKAIVETLATFLHSTYRALYKKESLQNEAVYNFTVEILSLIKEKYEQATVLQQDGPASPNTDEEGNDRED